MNSGSTFVILSLYVDDILLFGNDLDLTVKIKTWLKSRFEMKDMGEESFILGIKITRDRLHKTIQLSQEAYLDGVLKKYKMEHCGLVDTPICRGTKLSKKMAPANEKERIEMNSKPYAQVVGSLMYAMLCTRPDLSFIVGLVSRFQSNPGIAHWIAVKRILRYIQKTNGYKLTYHTDSLHVQGYSDAYFSGDVDGLKSTGGYVFTPSGAAISWSSKKQSCVAKSTMEAEFIACNRAASEAVWVKGFLVNLKLIPDKPINIFCDNQAALCTIANGELSGDPAKKHIERQYCYVIDIVKKKKITVSYLGTKDMIVDPLTKSIATEDFKRHVISMGLIEDLPNGQVADVGPDGQSA